MAYIAPPFLFPPLNNLGSNNLGSAVENKQQQSIDMGACVSNTEKNTENKNTENKTLAQPAKSMPILPSSTVSLVSLPSLPPPPSLPPLPPPPPPPPPSKMLALQPPDVDIYGPAFKPPSISTTLPSPTPISTPPPPPPPPPPKLLTQEKAKVEEEDVKDVKEVEEDDGDGEGEGDGMVVTGLEIDVGVEGVTLESFLMKQMGWIPESPMPLVQLVTQHDGGLWPQPSQSVAFVHHNVRLPADLPASTKLLREQGSKFLEGVETFLEQLPPTETPKIGLAWFEGRLPPPQLERALVAISPHLAEGAVLVFERLEMRNKLSHNRHLNILFEYLVAAKSQRAKFEWIARLGPQIALRSISLPRPHHTTTH